MIVDVVAVVAVAAGAPPPEGVPPWLTYLVSGIVGSPFVVALGWVIVRAIAKRLGVQADTPQGAQEESPANRTEADAGARSAPAERYDAKMAIIEQAFRRQDERIAELGALAARQAALLAAMTAERDQLAWLYEQATGRPVPGPPPSPPPPPLSPSPAWPENLPGRSPGSTSAL